MSLRLDRTAGRGDAGESQVDVRASTSERRRSPRVQHSGVATLFRWHCGGWDVPQVAIIQDLSDSGTRIVTTGLDTIDPDEMYALRFYKATREPLWMVCAVSWHKGMEGDLTQVGFRFATEIQATVAA